MDGASVIGRVERRAGDPQFVGSAKRPNRYLAAVGDQNLPEHGALQYTAAREPQSAETQAVIQTQTDRPGAKRPRAEKPILDVLTAVPTKGDSVGFRNG